MAATSAARRTAATKRASSLDDMVGGHDGEDAVRVARGDGQRGDGDGRRRVARDRLQDDGRGRDAGALQLLADQEAVVVVAEQRSGGEARLGAQPPQRRAEEASAPRR